MAVELLPIFLSATLMFLTACNVGPKYHRPSAPTPAAYKEAANWKIAQPQDRLIRGKWWEIYHDPQLNALEEQVAISNQNVRVAFENFLAARAVVKQARSQYYPTLTVAPSATGTKVASSGNQFTAPSSNVVQTTGPFATYALPFDASWAPDLWDAVRNTVRADTAAAQAAAANVENVRLTAQAELAVDYFALRGQDALKEVLHSNVIALQKSLDLTKVRFNTGIDSEQSVAQAETQLATVTAQETGVEVQRAQFEHAIATLMGKPPAALSLSYAPLKGVPPPIPPGVPSELLERRPDIAAAERSMAQANAQIGVAKAAYYPNLTLTGTAGFQSSTIVNLFTIPSLAWTVGGKLSEEIFDAGRRRAVTEQARANYESTVATYRQTVLTAFQAVEDNLASLHILSRQLQQQQAAVKAAQRNLDLSLNRYFVGIDSYLNVIVAHTALLSDQQTLVNIQIQQMTASVQLILALGGGWSTAQLPSPKAVLHNPPPAP